jgi:hypothetical protein
MLSRINKFTTMFFPAVLFLTSAFTPGKQENIEFVCMKTHKASNTCHFNFKVDGANYRFVDVGCKYKKKEDVIKKVQDGSLGLAKEWKITCPEPREKP